MQITREDLVLAAEEINLREDDYTIHGDYAARNSTPCAGVVLDPAHTASFLDSLARVLAEDGREDDAWELVEKTHTETRGFTHAVYWPSVELTD
jgi:hypothetical protein